MLIELQPEVLNALIVCCLLSILAVFGLRWRHYSLARKYAHWQKEAQAVEVATHVALYDQSYNEVPVYPNISVVVPARNQATQLEAVLLKLLHQEYAGQFEVIVADQKSTDDTMDVVKRLQERYANLRLTYVPQSSRYIELRKLAVTLGIKASYSDWVIVVNPETVPVTKQWLQHYSENLLPDIDFVEAYYNYEYDESETARRAILERVRTLCQRLSAYENGCVLGCGTANFAVRKAWFIEQQGFADSLNIPFGEENIFAYNHAKPERTAYLCSPDTKLLEEMPTSHEMREQRICDAEANGMLKGAACKYRVRESAASVFLYAALSLNLLYGALRVWQDVENTVYSMSFVYTDVLSLLCWVSLFAIPALALRRSAKALGEMPFGVYVLWHELLQPWRNRLIAFARHLHRNDFKRKYLG